MTPSQLKKKREIWSRRQIKRALYWFSSSSRWFVKMDSLRIQTDKDSNHHLLFYGTANSMDLNSTEYDIVVFNEKEDLREEQIKQKIYSIMMQYIEDRVNFIRESYWSKDREDNSYWNYYPISRIYYAHEGEKP